MIKIPLSSPDITDLEKNAVLDVLDTPNLSLGPKINEFEEKFATYIGTRYAIAVNSGTSGLHLCVRALNIKDGDEVFTTPFSFVASANCILFERAKPVFVDIDENTLNIDINKLASVIEQSKSHNQRTKAILPVHVFGRPCEMTELNKLAQDNNLEIIEDACEAIGAKYKTKNVGTFGKCAVFAFYPNKQMTTGEGGMIVTDDENLYKFCRALRNQGRTEGNNWLQHEYLGYNYRLSDINCALGIAQLQRIKDILNKRQQVANLYKSKLSKIENIILPAEEDNKLISWFVYVIRLTENFSMEDRDSILEYLRAAGIGCNNYFTPIHLQPFYQKQFGFKKGDFPITEKVSERTIALPFYNDLTEEEIDYIVNALKKTLDTQV